MLRPLLEYLIHPLVEDPKKVRIDCIETTEVVLFCVWASKGDLGRLLGKKGQTVEDLRTVMDTVSQRAGKEVIIDVVEDQPPRRRRRRRSGQRKGSQKEAGQKKSQDNKKKNQQPEKGAKAEGEQSKPKRRRRRNRSRRNSSQKKTE